MVLPNEQRSAFTKLTTALRDELQPLGELEELLVDRLIAGTWRLRRLYKVEAGLYQVRDLDTRPAGLASQFSRDCNNAGAFEKLSRYESALERNLHRALQELERLQVRRSETQFPGRQAENVCVLAEIGT
jgi:hypothetical protein